MLSDETMEKLEQSLKEKEKTKMFNKATFKSKTTWGIIGLALWNALALAGGITGPTVEIGNWIISTFTGVSAVDRTTRILSK
jgi:hypothetical protein